MKEDKLLMTEGTIWKVLVSFALPLLLGNFFQQMYNTVDSLVVGQFCSNQSLAAVSSAGSLCHLLVGFCQGLSVGAGVVISSKFGARDNEAVDKAVHTTVVFAFGLGALVSVIGVLFTPIILQLMNTPDSVMSASTTYFRVYCTGLLGLVMYNTANGIFQALGDSKHPLYYLIFSSVLNVVLDLLFVAVFDMDVAGAALATVLAQILSAVIALGHLMSGKFIVQIKLSKLKADKALVKQIFTLGMPSGVQNSVTSLANVVIQGYINGFGDIVMAGVGAYTKIEGFIFIPMMCLGMALTTFVSQNMGAGKVDRVREGVKIGLWIDVAIAVAFSLVYILFAEQMMNMFTDDPDVIQAGIITAKVSAPFYMLLAFSNGTGAVMRGAGQAVIPMVVMLGAWCALRVVYMAVVTKVVSSLAIVMAVYPITWTVSAIIFAVILFRGKWIQTGLERLQA